MLAPIKNTLRSIPLVSIQEIPIFQKPAINPPRQVDFERHDSWFNRDT
jgi:hypothetical protein